jgi:hypothetical protein
MSSAQAARLAKKLLLGNHLAISGIALDFC